MVTVQETMDLINTDGLNVPGSLIIKMFDDKGVVLKWLIYTDAPTNSEAVRKQCFLEVDPNEMKE